MPDRTVAIVDDHPLLAEGVATLLRRWGGFTLTATGNVADDILSITKTHQPDFMIVDLSMAGDVFQAISDTLKIAAETRIVVFTASTSTDDAIAALNAGAKGYVLKGSPSDDLFQALNAAQRGDVHVTPSFAAKLIGALKDQNRERQKPASDRLSVREEQIVRLLLLGKMNNEIAHELSLSAKTVKGYMTNLMVKMHVRNRLEVVIAAQKHIPPPSGTSVTRIRP
ncbi:response regulator [Bosea sp. 2YAB26]|uniref:LuxR C-terminal-related transcriptional regulator n=1 Tax=unclassified Bosea (in: a-proteobacteria) TaxID=2653178 RepID=UPI003F90554C